MSDNEPLADWAPSSVFVKQKRSEALFSKHEETELDPRDFVEVSLAERKERVELVSDSSLEEAEEVIEPLQPLQPIQEEQEKETMKRKVEIAQSFLKMDKSGTMIDVRTQDEGQGKKKITKSSTKVFPTIWMNLLIGFTLEQREHSNLQYYFLSQTKLHQIYFAQTTNLG